MKNLKIRYYTPADFNEVIQLHRVALKDMGTYIGGPWENDLYNIEEIYLKNNGTFLIGCINNQIIAMGALQKISKEKAEIKRMRVLPQFQQQGFGQAILNQLETEAIKRGYKIICLDTTILQVVAQKMYLKNGYTETKRIKEGFPFENIFYEKRL